MQILIKPIITEKSSKLGESLNQYGFVVNKKASKDEIREAVEKMYGVNVRKVNTMNYLGKKRIRFTKSGVMQGKKSDFKKAIVSILDGQTIDFYESV